MKQFGNLLHFVACGLYVGSGMCIGVVITEQTDVVLKAGLWLL